MSTSFAFNQDFDSDDEDAAGFHSTSHGRDATIVVIDASAEMFTEFDEIEETTSCVFSTCLSVLDRLMLNKIISNNKDLLGVVLYNTQHSPEPQDELQVENLLPVPKNCAILIPLKQIESESIQYIKNLKNSPDFMDFDKKFGHSTNAKISDVLWLCSSMFSGCGKKIRVPQIMWFTDEDVPHKDGSTEHQQAFQKAKDLQQLQLDLQFYPMKIDFNGDLFYKELICQLLDYDSDDYQFPKPQLNERLLLQRMFRRGYNKRAVTYLNVEIAENAKFSVGIYGFTRKTQTPKFTKITRDTKEEIVAKRSFKVAAVPEEDELMEILGYEENQLDFKEKLEPSMAVKVQDCGGEKICFTPLEAYEIKQISEPKIKILGFKPLSVISEHNHVKCPYFLYPTDSKIKNSSVLFRALWERCLEDKKVIICAFTMRLKSNSRLVALVPQEQEERGGDFIRFDGFRMVFIPFAGDIRDLSEMFQTPPEVDEETEANLKKIVAKLQVKFAPTTIENPAVKKIYSKIEENVYNEEPDEDLTSDLTLPNLAAQDGRIGEFVDVLEALFDGFVEVPTTKRKAAESNGEPKRKKVNADEINMDLILELCVKGDLKSLTVPMLKSYLEVKKVSGTSKLNKAQLVEKIVELG